MSIRGAKPSLTHPSRFISRGLQHIGTHSDSSLVKTVNVIDVEVRHVAVIAKFAGVRNVEAAAKHECDLASATETPIARSYVVELASEDIAVPGSRDIQIMNGQHRVRTRDAHGSILPRGNATV